MITHNHDLAAGFERRVDMRDGRIVDDVDRRSVTV
jgi:ABC-type lipoprotein export system ATPase subunit